MRTLCRTLVALALLLAAACTPDYPGITDLDSYLQHAAHSLEVGHVLCEEQEIRVGESMTCQAYTVRGTRLAAEGAYLVIWTSSDPVALPIDIAGRVEAVEPGVVRVYADGPRGSSAWYEVTVVE